MDYQLSNQATRSLQTLSGECWSKILSLAKFYGWQPMGTLPPYIHNLRNGDKSNQAQSHWDGNYVRPQGQIVQGEDALMLAIALRMSLDDIPDVNPDRDLTLKDDLLEWLSPDEKTVINNGLEDLGERYDEPPLEILPFEFFAGDGKQNLVDFIHFCMLGEFVIS